uniref:Uncharacterized protein n=1 Tax=Anguilla anguilla TaxID=7936 RepID=A0A0E9QP65_ANGAN
MALHTRVLVLTEEAAMLPYGLIYSTAAEVEERTLRTLRTET